MWTHHGPYAIYPNPGRPYPYVRPNPISTGAAVALTLLGITVVGGVVYVAWRRAQKPPELSAKEKARAMAVLCESYGGREICVLERTAHVTEHFPGRTSGDVVALVVYVAYVDGDDVGLVEDSTPEQAMAAGKSWVDQSVAAA